MHCSHWQLSVDKTQRQFCRLTTNFVGSKIRLEIDVNRDVNKAGSFKSKSLKAKAKSLKAKARSLKARDQG